VNKLAQLIARLEKGQPTFAVPEEEILVATDSLDAYLVVAHRFETSELVCVGQGGSREGVGRERDSRERARRERAREKCSLTTITSQQAKTAAAARSFVAQTTRQSGVRHVAVRVVDNENDGPVGFS
jgi:hypothetical protein